MDIGWVHAWVGLDPCVSIVGWFGLSEEKWTQVHLWTECFCGGHLYRTALTRRQRSIFICDVRVITSFPLFKAAPTATFFDLPTFLQVAIFVWTYGKSPAAAFTLWMLFRKTHPVLWAALLPSVPSTHHHPSPLTLPLQAWNLSFPQILPTVAFFFFSSSFLAVSRGKSGCKLPAKFFFVFLLFDDKCSVF